MAAAFRAASRFGDGQTTAVASPQSIAVPSSGAGGTVIAGDVATLIVDADLNPVLTTPTGWTLQGSDAPSSSAKSWVFTKTLTAGDLGSNVTLAGWTGSIRIGAVMTVDSGVTETGLQIDKVTQGTATGTYTLPVLTGVPASAMLRAIFARRRSGAAGTITVPSPYATVTNGDAANNYATGANTFTRVGHVVTGGGSVGGEAGSTALTSIGTNWLVSLPESVTAATRSAALGGSGTLAAAGSAPTATQAATPGGSGTLAGTGVPGYARSAALGGDGTLAVIGVVNFVRAGTLSGDGTLGALPIQSFILPAALTGLGELQAAGLGTSEASLGSTGTLVGFPYFPSVTVIATLAGGGTLVGLTAPGLVKDAGLSGSGSLAAFAIIPPRAAALSGTGHLATFGVNLVRIGLVTPTTFRLGAAMPTKLYLGDVLIWSP